MLVGLHAADFDPVPELLDGWANDHDFYYAEALHRITLVKGMRRVLAAAHLAGGDSALTVTLEAVLQQLTDGARQSIEGYDCDGGTDAAALLAQLEAQP